MNITPPVPVHHAPSQESALFFGGANYLVVKLTDYCNLRCTYCHQDALNGKPILMPMETFKNAVRLILKPSVAPKVYVQFHGGEPLLCPDEFFREAVAWAKEELTTPQREVAFSIQTNLVKVDAPREQMLKDLKVNISYSLDGPPAINDELRGGGRKILENWRRMKGNGTQAGTICLISPANWDRMPEVIKFFHDEGIHSIKFNLLVPDGRGKQVETATVEKLLNAKKYVLDYMLETRGQSVVDASLYNAMKKFVKANGAPASFEYHGCESFYCQAGRSLYSINPDGKFYACDRIAENPLWAMGNVNQLFEEREKMHAQKKRSAFQHKDEWWARCEGCNAKKICEFSCSAYYVDQVDTREIECQYTKAMWEYFLEKKDQICEFMQHIQQPIFIDEKKPLEQQSSETWAVKDLAIDAFYDDISLVNTLASNRHFRLYHRNGQYFIYLFARQRIFEVDETVAEIAKFNGMVPPHVLEGVLSHKFPPGKIGETLSNISRFLPEVFYGMEKNETTIAEHALHELGHVSAGETRAPSVPLS